MEGKLLSSLASERDDERWVDVFAKPGPALARARVAIGKIYVFHTLASSLQVIVRKVIV